MRLNWKKTVAVGLAFFLISLFWQAYDTIIPKILVDKFGLNQTISGAIMALDNVLALFLLPLFGTLSDKTQSRWGRRTPYIVIGTVLAATLFVGTSFIDNLQLTNLEKAGIYDNAVIYDSGVLEEKTITVQGEKMTIAQALERQGITREEFCAIELYEREGTSYRLENGEKVINQQFIDWVKPARQAFAWKQTVENPVTLIVFMIVLLMVLLSMSTFRSPAVALMPDVTVKPLRSKANAVINLMGAAGGMLVLLLGIVFQTGSAEKSLMSYVSFFSVVAAIMLLALILFKWRVNEPKWVADMQAEQSQYQDWDTVDVHAVDCKSRNHRKSLICILVSVFLWYMGYNAVISKFSIYAGSVLAADYNLTLIIAQGAAIVAFLPIGMISSRIGRKKTILAGIILLGAAFGFAFWVTPSSSALMYILFCMAGIGWASINVNSYPMVVEMSGDGDVGKYTGYYYTFSMAAQIITPILSGLFMDVLGLKALFPYATVFVLLAFVSTFFVRYGDNRLPKA